MESPKRKMQKQNDYQRHKLFRKIKRRRKALAELEQEIATKLLKKKLKLPKYNTGTDDVIMVPRSLIGVDLEGNVLRNGLPVGDGTLRLQDVDVRPRNPFDIDIAERNAEMRLLRSEMGDAAYEEYMNKLKTLHDIHMANIPQGESIYGYAADAIDGLMTGVSMLPGPVSLAGDEYWALRGAKQLSQGDLWGALGFAPIIGKSLPEATRLAKTAYNSIPNYSKTFSKLADKRRIASAINQGVQSWDGTVPILYFNSPTNFRLLSNGRYAYEGHILPNKTIYYDDQLIKNASYFNSQDGMPYALNTQLGAWDSKIINSEIQKGRQELVNWVNNPEFIKALQQNEMEAQKMGLNYIPLAKRQTFPERLKLLDNPSTYKLYVNQKSPEVGYVENPIGDYGKQMNINLANIDPYRTTIRHEGGHMLGIGGVDLPASNSLLMKNELEYLRHKTRQVLKPGYEYFDLYDLSEYPYEAVQNLRDLGQELGLKVGLEYPGYDKALKILSTKVPNKLWLMPYLKTDKESMPYLWKALVGTQFASLPFYLNFANNNK